MAWGDFGGTIIKCKVRKVYRKPLYEHWALVADERGRHYTIEWTDTRRHELQKGKRIEIS